MDQVYRSWHKRAQTWRAWGRARYHCPRFLRVQLKRRHVNLVALANEMLSEKQTPRRIMHVLANADHSSKSTRQAPSLARLSWAEAVSPFEHRSRGKPGSTTSLHTEYKHLL